ncbi:MAG: ABC transporter substrate binding protein [Tepidanaerobacteraceae bacterium]|nr:ABC transporter substrate binding protein [Tepidanaerobacteraceae bacterium]
MKIKKHFFFIVVLSIIVMFSAYQTYAGIADEDVFRVAYLEGDPYVNYAGNLSGIIFGLSQLGMVDDTSDWAFKDGSDDASLIWNWLENHTRNEIEFVGNEFYQLIFMSDQEKVEFVRHMNEDADIDLILVMGTSASKFIRENNINTNAMIMSVTNAYEAGVVDGLNYSGIENIWAHVSPNRYYNQLNVFYDLFRFKRLGIVYENSENGRNEIAYEDIKRFVKSKDIDLIEVPVDANIQTDRPEYYEEKMIEGYHMLSEKADAVYMANSGGRTEDRIIEYLEPLYQKGIPVFSQTGKNDVKNGAMMTIYRYNFQEIGNFCAQQFVSIMEGKSPGQLEQGYDESQALCFNIAAAEKAGLKLPFKALVSADTIFTSTSSPNL